MAIGRTTCRIGRSARAATLLARIGGGALLVGAACHLYVDEPAQRPIPRPLPRPVAASPYPPPSPPPLQRRVVPIRLRGAAPGPPGAAVLATGPGAAAASTSAPGAPPATTSMPTSAPTSGPTDTPATLAAAATAPTVCLDENPTPVPDCSAVHAPDGSCAPFPFAQQKCQTYKAYFDPKVAAFAVSCMVALSSKQLCDPTPIDNCGRAALSQACQDPAVGQLCSIAAGPCKATPTECESLLSGLNDQGKELAAQCVARGCQSGLLGCVEGLAAPSSALR